MWEQSMPTGTGAVCSDSDHMVKCDMSKYLLDFIFSEKMIPVDIEEYAGVVMPVFATTGENMS